MQTFSNAIFVATFFILPIAPMRYMFFAISKFLVINFSKTEFKRMHNVTWQHACIAYAVNHSTYTRSGQSNLTWGHISAAIVFARLRHLALWDHASYHPKRHLYIGSAVFARLICVPNTQTDTQTTEHATSIATDRIYIQCMGYGLKWWRKTSPVYIEASDKGRNTRADIASRHCRPSVSAVVCDSRHWRAVQWPDRGRKITYNILQ